MKTRTWLGLLFGSVLLAIPQGCGGVDEIPLNPFVDLQVRTATDESVSQDVIQLPLEGLDPDEARIGDWVEIHGRGRIFPAGYARFHFSGNAEVEVAVPAATDTLRVRVPTGTISGALGFVISQQSSSVNGGGQAESTGPAPTNYRIAHPGLVILE